MVTPVDISVKSDSLLFPPSSLNVQQQYNNTIPQEPQLSFGLNESIYTFPAVVCPHEFISNRMNTNLLAGDAHSSRLANLV